MCTFQARQISDPILQSIPKVVDFSEMDKIQNCLEIMKNTQKHLGGVGIACNQCFIDDPLQIIFIGTADPITHEAAKKRYPKEKLPNLIIMLNPTILEYSDKTYYPDFGEGCLSVDSDIRGKVLRHESVTVEYFNLDGEKIIEEFSGFAAHIVQHEYDHLSGIEYLQKILLLCSDNQKKDILKYVNREIEYRKINNIAIDLAQKETPTLVFDINESSDVTIDFNKLEDQFKKMSNTTLLGIKEFL